MTDAPVGEPRESLGVLQAACIHARIGLVVAAPLVTGRGNARPVGAGQLDEWRTEAGENLAQGTGGREDDPLVTLRHQVGRNVRHHAHGSAARGTGEIADLGNFGAADAIDTTRLQCCGQCLLYGAIEVLLEIEAFLVCPTNTDHTAQGVGSVAECEQRRHEAADDRAVLRPEGGTHVVLQRPAPGIG